MTTVVAILASTLALALALRLLRSERRARGLAARLAEAQQAACTDPLTGLANRNGLLDAFAELRQTAAPGDHHALVLFDLDRLKPINDTHGHDAGDHVLREVARRLALPTAHIRCAARLGGDEFVVLLSPARPEAAARLAETSAISMRSRIGTPIAVDGTRFTITSSAGIAVLPADRLEHLLTAADHAMYRAKHARIGVSHYRPELDGPPGGAELRPLHSARRSASRSHVTEDRATQEPSAARS